MENSLIPNRKFQEQFRNDLMSIKNEFWPKLTKLVKSHFDILKNEIDKKNISFSNNLFGRKSILKILEEISENIIEELLKEEKNNLRKIIKDNLSLPIKTDNNGRSSIDGYAIELYIAKARYLCFLIDHSPYLQHLSHFKWNLSFSAELFSIIITRTTRKAKVCPLCFRDISEGNKNVKGRSRDRKYCHIHKTNDEDANAKNILGKEIFNNLSQDSKNRHKEYSYIKKTSGDYFQLTPNTQKNRLHEQLKSFSYHGVILSFGDNPTFSEDMEYFRSKSISIDSIPSNIEEIESALIEVQPAIKKIFTDPAYVKFIESAADLDWKKSWSFVYKTLAQNFPKTFSTFKAPIPKTNSLTEFTNLIQGKNYLDNEKNHCTHFFLLVTTLNISEDLLIEGEKINLAKQQRASKVQKILELYDQGLNVSDIKKNLDSLGQNTGRPFITKIINARTKKIL